MTWKPTEIESYRQITFGNIIEGLREVLDAMTDFHLEISEENVVRVFFLTRSALSKRTSLQKYLPLITLNYNIREGDPFPADLLGPLMSLWNDPNVKKAYARANEAALPDKYATFSII